MKPWLQGVQTTEAMLERRVWSQRLVKDADLTKKTSILMLDVFLTVTKKTVLAPIQADDTVSWRI